MFRAIRNIALLLIVGVIASGIPLYADTPNFDLSLSISSRSNLSLDVQLDQVTGAHWDVTVILSTDGKAIPIDFNPARPLSIDLYHDELHIKKLDLKDLTDQLPDFTEEILVKDSFTLHFSIMQEAIDIPDGDYRLEIKPILRSLDADISPYNVAINFETNFHYIPALQSINRNETALTLYFPDTHYNHLVPITRVIPYTNTPLSATINNLRMGPIEELGLPEGSPIPATTGLRLSKGIADVYLPLDTGSYGNSSASTYITVNSFVNSLASINEVNGVQFYFGGRIREIGFHDLEVGKPFYPTNMGKVYAGVMTEHNRALLTPIAFHDSTLSKDLVFEQLKYKGNVELYRYGIIPAIPPAVELMSHSLQDGILTLELNEGFLEAYPNNDQKKLFMLEAILYSFTSLEDVEAVIFKVGDNTITSYGGVEFQSPHRPTQFINPEK